MHTERGFLSGKLLGGLLVVALAVLAGLYFFSDVFRTKAKGAWKEFAEWTPQNIAEDPVGYLDFAEERAKDTQVKLRASEISLGQRKGKLESMKEEAARKVAAGTKALDELRAAYKAAEAGGAWPVEWNGVKRDKDWTKQQIMKLHGEVTGQSGLLDKLTAGLQALQTESRKVDAMKAQLEQQLQTIATNRELVKADEISKDVKDQLVSMKGILESTVANVGTTGSSLVSLEELASQAAAQVDDAEFEKVLGK